MNERRVIAITGASAGIGAALALRAARAGYAVVANGRNAEALELLAARIECEGGAVRTIAGDVRSPLTSERIATAAMQEFGRLDVLVANAGVAGRGPLAVQSDEELREQFETHVFAPLTLIRSCLPLLSASKGTAFVVGSGVARMPICGMGLYPASKAALRSASRTLRNELRPLGIGLTYVDPGVVDTEFMARQSMPGAPRVLRTSPHTVARKMLAAVERRPAELDVCGWQTLLLSLGEMAPRLTDYILAHAGAITGAPVTHVALSRNDAITRLRSEVSMVQTQLEDIRPEPEPYGAASTVDRRTIGHSATTPPHANFAAWVGERPGASQRSTASSASPIANDYTTAGAPDARTSTNGTGGEVKPAAAATNASTEPIAAAKREPAQNGAHHDNLSLSAAASTPPAAPPDAEDLSARLKAATSKAESPVARQSETSPQTPPPPAKTEPATESPAAAETPAPPAADLEKPPARSRNASRLPKFAPEDDAITITMAPFVSRMRRLSFPPDMLRLKIEAGKPFSEDELALDWVGMPNKNERKLITDLCQACAEAGMLSATSERHWKVLTTTPERRETGT